MFDKTQPIVVQTGKNVYSAFVSDVFLFIAIAGRCCPYYRAICAKHSVVLQSVKPCSDWLFGCFDFNVCVRTGHFLLCE